MRYRSFATILVTFALAALVGCGGAPFSVADQAEEPDTGSNVETPDSGPKVDTDGDSSPTKVDAGQPVAVAEAGQPDTGKDSGQVVAEASVDAGPASCAAGGAGQTNCGANENCCTSPEVPGGPVTFFAAYEPDGGVPPPDPSLALPSTVSGFRLDKFLVTVGRFRQFVSAWNGGAGWVPAAGSGKHADLNNGQGLTDNNGSVDYEPGWVASDDSNVNPTNKTLTCDQYSTWTNLEGSRETQPINCVNWFEAYAFCIWDGGFLPSERERAYAQTGGSQNRPYPWGSTDPGTHNQYAIFNDYYTGDIAPVGTATLGAGLWGQLDLTGEVQEWNLDWSGGPTNETQCTDCALTDTSGVYKNRVTSRAYWGSTADDLHPYSSAAPPANRTSQIGFRCARTP